MTTQLSLNYLPLMQGAARRGDRPFFYTAYDKAGEVGLEPQGRNIILFVLQGSLTCTFRSGCVSMETGTLMAMDKKQLRRCDCAEQTVLLEYQPPLRMSDLLGQCAVAFDTPCSDCVSMDEWLRGWCWRLLDEFSIDIPRERSFYLERCQQLATLLLKCPRKVLGNLYVPLQTCSLNNCNCARCDKTMVCEAEHDSRNGLSVR